MMDENENAANCFFLLPKCKAAPKQVRHAQEAHAHTFRNTQDNEY